MSTNNKKKKKRVGRTIALVFLTLVLLAGLIIALFPVLNGVYHRWYANREIEEFIAISETITPIATVPPTASDEIASEEPEEEPVEEAYKPEYTELRAAMEEYNQRIYEEKQEGLCDAWSYTNPSFVLEDYGINDGAMGVVEIPSLNIRLPLYLGATYNHLSNGAAQLSQTSLPIGGINTNCVIAGHCGWRGSNYFRYLSQIQIGAKVYITNLWETMTYEVVETAIIWPYDTDKILIQEGKDMVTLFTCHPYASGGRFRFVVYCERISETPEDVLGEIDITAVEKEEIVSETATAAPEPTLDVVEAIASYPIDYTGGEVELYEEEMAVVIPTGSAVTDFIVRNGKYFSLAIPVVIALFVIGVIATTPKKKTKEDETVGKED